MSEFSATAFAGRDGGRAPQTDLSLRLSIANPVWEAVATAALCPLLLAAAIWNGFPFIFYDTGAYMLQSFGEKFVPERAPVYSLFLKYAGGGESLWLIAILQALMVSFVMVETARMLAPRMTLKIILLIACGLVLLTGLPWYAAQIEPDAFTPLVVLTSYLLAFHASRLGLWRCLALICVGALAAAVHPSHLGLAIGLVIALAIFRTITWWKRSDAWPGANFLLPAVSAALGLTMIFAANYHFTRQVFISRAGPVFMFARMLQDGVVQKVLTETCPTSDYMLCRYRTRLPHRADKWLWGPGTLFVKLHRFIGTQEESGRIVHDALTRYPLWNAELAARDALQQFFLFYTGDQIEPQQWVLFADFHKFIPHQMAAYASAHQQKGEIRFRLINVIHVPFGWLVLALLAASLVLAFRRDEQKAATVLGFVLVAMIGNAVICGVFSNPHARYQSRLIWVPAFAMALLASDRRVFFQRTL